MNEEPNQWQQKLAGLVSGDAEICAQFWDEYGVRLRRVAGSRLPGYVQQRVDAEDLVQSVCRTFFRRLNSGQITLENDAAMWSLLCAITLNKVRMKLRFHQQQRRSPNREEQPASDADRSPSDFLPDRAKWTPDEEAMFDEELQLVLGELDEEAQRSLQLKLEGYSNKEIAEQLMCSERTVRRIFERTRELLANRLGDSIGMQGS